MSQGYRFDRTARAERYFVGSMLVHLLMANNFHGLKKLFREIFKDEITPDINSSTDYEIVSELDALRDGSVQNNAVKKLYRELRRVAVPDLFLRWSTKCLVIEAKFFTDPSGGDLVKQINLQKEAIEHVKAYTKYKDFFFKYSALTANPQGPFLGDVYELSWEELLVWITDKNSASEDELYAHDILRCALDRLANEVKAGNGITFEKLKFDQLMDNIPRLIKEKKIYIGFTGGISALMESELEELESRSHFKVSDIRWTDNWISLDLFLQKIFAVRGLFDNYDDSSE